MMRNVVLAVLVCLCSIVDARAQAQGKCDPEAAPTAEQQARRRDGVRIARLVNTVQANQPSGTNRKYLRQDELATSAYVRKQTDAQDPFVKSLNFKTGDEVLPGWDLRVDVTANGYWFVVKDKTDACGFAFISNQDGLIYTAKPLR